MDLPTLRQTVARGLDFLRARQHTLYGDRPVRFEPDAPYFDFDRMLKREVAYMKFDVLERLAEGRLKMSRSAFELKVLHTSLPRPRDARSAPEAFSTFLVRRKYLTYAASQDFHLALPSFEGEAQLRKAGPGEFSLAAKAMAPTPLASYATLATLQESLEAEILAWFRAALAEWTVGVADVRVLGHQSGDPDETPAAGAWRRFSQVDVDASAEEEPHVFRWQEASRAAAARYADLPEAECLSILAAQGARVPAESRLVGISRDELADDAECVTLRYVHVLPDSQGTDPDPSVPWRSRGDIVVEGDYWEFHVDAATRTLLGEGRKWRPVTPA